MCNLYTENVFFGLECSTLCVGFGLIPLPGALTNMHGWMACPERSQKVQEKSDGFESDRLDPNACQGLPVEMGSNKGYTYAGSGSGVQGGSYQLNLFKGVGNSDAFSGLVLEIVGTFEQAVSQDSNVQAIYKYYLHVCAMFKQNS